MHKIIGVLLATISLAGCSSNSYYADRRIDTYDNYKPVTSVTALVYNLGKTTAYSVPRGARQEHENCVYMVLDNGQIGDSCNWRTDDAYGIVRVVAIKPNLCHTLMSTVHYKNSQDSFIDTACLTKDNNWKFYAE